MLRSYIRKIDEKLFHGAIRKIYIRLFHRELLGFIYSSEYASQVEEYVKDPKIREELKYVDPKNVLTSGRLDIIARYYLFKDIAYNKENSAHKSLYCRTIMTRTGAIEPKEFFSTNDKEGIERHIEVAKELSESIKKKGFDKKEYIPIGEDFGIYNGAHRLACAMALDEDVWVRICGDHGVKDMDFSWFDENGFSNDDKIRLLRGFADIHKQCGIFILYHPSYDRWEYIQNEMKKYMNIVGFVDLDYTHDYIGYENLIRDIYHTYDESEDNTISRKINLLKLSRLIVRVILVSDERDSVENDKLSISDDYDLYDRIVRFKAEIRKKLKYDVEDDAYITLHASDTEEEFEDLKQIVLSVNNLKWISKRPKISIRKDFIVWLQCFKEWADNNNINTDDTCIVGSSPLEVFGIRDSTDIDIMVAPELRYVFGNGLTHVTELLDIGTRNYVRSDKEVLVTDEQLIYDDEYHFMFMGFKFANPELVQYRKSFSDQEKDIKDVKLLKIFFDYTNNFDNKEVLVKQIEREVKRRNLS
ncbi:MAG: hypothetical protein NC420_00515 [Eubacterium sp.]|nr:hypothetical protein [Eubacterium sp.]MCM1342930.1 hypothetical protein [Muribaculaceae bacterium]MCM1411376.1 hypothetical protein [Lachnospiraceae bacterium]